MKRSIVTGFVLVGSLFMMDLHAERLTLQETLSQSLQHYPQLRATALKVAQSKSAYRSAYADYLPQVNLTAQYNGVQTFVFPVNGAFHTVDDQGWSATVALKQKVWDFSQTKLRVHAKKVDETIAKLSLEEAKAQLAYRVKSLYATMVLQQEAIDVRKADLRTKEAYYKQAQALLKEGLKTKADTARLRSALFVAKESLESAKSAYNKARKSLELYMGSSIDPAVELDHSVLKQQLQVQKKRLYAALEQQNYTLAIERKNIEKNRLLKEAAKASHYGSVDLVASYSHLDTLNAYDAKVAGVTLNIPLYTGGRLQAEAKKAALSTQIAQEERASLDLSLKEELTNLLLDIEHYGVTIAAKKALIVSAKETEAVMQGRYAQGLATYIELLDADTLLLDANLGLLEAYYQRALALYRIDYLKGIYNE